MNSQNGLTESSLVAREAGNLSISLSTLYNKGRREKVFGTDVKCTNLQYLNHTHRCTNQKGIHPSQEGWMV